MAISYFCDHCGAENAPGETVCCACQYPLTQQADRLDANTLLNERYEVLSEIGAGGFGAVYQARDTQKSNQLVAVKQINLKGLSSQEIIEATDAFNREAEILSTLSHPLLPRIFDRFSDPEHWYLVMTFIDGSTLDEYLQQHMVSSLPASAGLPLSETLAIALQLCDALHYLHSQQPPVIFRDLKPGNIMRTRGGRLYLIDFGIARRFKPGQAKDTIPFGSPGFAAPEQYGRAQTTPQADIYSLGALLSCLISGDDPSEHPFEFPPLRHNGVAGMHELDVLIWRMVALDATRRPADILAVQIELQRIQQIYNHANPQTHIWTPPPGQAPLPAGSGQQHLFLNPTSTQPPKRRTTRRTVLTVGLVAGGVALVGGIAALGNLSQPQPQPVSQTDQSIGINTDQQTADAQNGDATATAINQPPVVPLNGPTYWSPDLGYAAVTNLNQDQIELYKVQGQQLIQTIKNPANFANPTVWWSPDNSKILAQSDTGMIYAWNAANGQQLFTFASAMASYSATFPPIPTWSPDGQICSLSYNNAHNNINFILFRANDGKQLFQKSLSDLSGIVWSPDSRYFIFLDSPGWLTGTPWSVDIWDSKTYQQVSSFGAVLPANTYNNTTESIISIAWSSGGKKLATILDNFIYISQFGSSQPANMLTNIGINTYGPINNSLWSPDEKYLALSAQQGLTILDTSSGQSVPINGDNINNRGSQGQIAGFVWSAYSKSIMTADTHNVLTQLQVG